MKKAFPLVTTEQYLKARESWLSELKKGENVAVVFSPKTDRYRRLHQLIEDKEFIKTFFGKKLSCIFQILDINIGLVEDVFDIYELIARYLNLSRSSIPPQLFSSWVSSFQKNNQRLVLVLPDAEKYLREENRHILALLFQVINKYAPTVTVLGFFEKDIRHPQYDISIPILHEMFETSFYYPLYSYEDTMIFIRYLQEKWETTISHKDERSIQSACGGHFWLIKEAVRELISKGYWSMTDEQMEFRLQAIWKAFHFTEQQIIERMVYRKQRVNAPEHSKIYLKKMRFIDERNAFAIELLRDFVRAKRYVAINVSVSGDHVTLNNIPLDLLFSRKERQVMQLLIQHKSEVVTRYMLATNLWPTHTEKQYSDLVIDQIITRIRKRLREVSLPPTVIEVVRGKGYTLNL